MAKFLFVANEQAIDFVNSEVVLDANRPSLVPSFADLVDLTQWFAEAGVAAASGMSKLATKWEGTTEARAALHAAQTLRGALRDAVQRVISNGRIPSDLSETLGKILRQPRLATDVANSQGRLTMKPRWVLEKPGDLLVPLAHYAASFFATADYSAIRKCENPECILFFYDTSKNHTRRWCSMEMCGNRAKVAAFRKRL
jgi:predicted RNA-binding Zn ribbon-like protein